MEGSRSISHGRTRKNTEGSRSRSRTRKKAEAEELATDEHGNKRRRAARVTKAQRVRPFDKLRDRSSIRSVSLPNYPLKLRDRSSPRIRGIQKDKQQKE